MSSNVFASFRSGDERGNRWEGNAVVEFPQAIATEADVDALTREVEAYLRAKKDVVPRGLVVTMWRRMEKP